MITADAILKFLFDSLRDNNDPISKEMLLALSLRVKERRNQYLVTLIKYLQTLDLHSTATPDPELPSSSKAAIIRYANELYTRIFSEDVDTEIEEIESSEECLTVTNIKDRLAIAINAAYKPKSKKCVTTRDA